MSPDPLGDKLAAIARATESAEPGAGLVEAIMSEVEAERAVVSPRRGWRDGVVRSGPVAVTLAAIAAAACLVLSMQAQASYDEEVMASVDVLEVSD